MSNCLLGDFYFIWALVNENNESSIFILSNTTLSFSLFLNINVCEHVHVYAHLCVHTGLRRGHRMSSPSLSTYSGVTVSLWIWSLCFLNETGSQWALVIYHLETSVSVCTRFLAHSMDAGIWTPVFMVHSKWLLSPVFFPRFHLLKLETTCLWTATWHLMVLSLIV